MQFDITIDLGPLQNLFDSAFGADEQAGTLDRSLRDILDASAQQLIVIWSKEATIALKHPAGYIAALTDQGSVYPFPDNRLGVVVENDHPAAYFLEMGTNAFDIKKMLGSSAKVKESKAGNRYIRIPLDQSRKSLDKYNIGEQASKLAPSKNLGLEAGQRRTKWGDRLKANDLGQRSKIFAIQGALAMNTAQRIGTIATVGKSGEATRLIHYTWKASPFQNVVRFEDKFGKTSGYKSFRTISDASDPDSWIHPGINASHIAEKASIEMRPIFIENVAAAVKDAFAKLGF